MYKPSTFLTQSKIIADILVLTLVVLFVEQRHVSNSLLTGSVLILLITSLVSWLFSASVLGLYNDFRRKPLSIESVVLLKAIILYILLFPPYIFLPGACNNPEETGCSLRIDSAIASDSEIAFQGCT